ncbi:MAG TPA: tRNA (adenosine(37)-N6)-threonylcarbamoyltransferase complex ATPase subunit type 1 TsaE [Candidatus Paceibacterota bacterium]|nr:tRNA (adenosine(37)-N6)-threonylcarbamoyltransferase complex ATPase subunit type 1 TsaE [Candidatus Paceibacterota bacterium]
MEKELHSLTEVEAAAAGFTQVLAPKDAGATLVTLSGELGAGKTTFTQNVAKALGVDGAVTSPTFVLMKVYQLPKEASFKRLVHIDAYRLQGGKELAPLGFDEVLHDKDNLVLLEWPEQVADGLPEADYKLRLEVLSENSRKLIYG